MPTHLIKIATGGVRRLINSQCLAIRHAFAFDESKQMIHRVEFRAGAWQEPDLNAKGRSQFERVFGSVGRTAIFKQDDAPTTPMGPNHLKEKLMRQCIPFVGDQQREVTGDDIDRSVNDALAAIACDRYAHLLSDPAVATTQRRGFGDDDFVQHQDDRPRLCPEAALEPPLASRQLSARSASV